MMNIYRIFKEGTSFMLSLSDAQKERFLLLGFSIQFLGRINL